MLARIFDDHEVYRPEGFGRFVTKYNVEEHVGRFYASRDQAPHTANLPVLLYHEALGYDDDPLISPNRFESHIKALRDSGYTPVGFRDIIDYVYGGTPLPEKPVCITFDDGYLSNYTQAYPILVQYNVKATMSVIGATVGQTERYKNTEFPITPHFSWEQARDMTGSGLVDVESHTFDMHQHPDYDAPNPRKSVLAFPNESEKEYLAVLAADHELMNNALLRELGHSSEVVAYPRGAFDTRSEALLRSLGVKVTLGAKPGTNELIMGLPQCLYGMHRFDASGVSAEEVLEYCMAR